MSGQRLIGSGGGDGRYAGDALSRGLLVVGRRKGREALVGNCGGGRDDGRMKRSCDVRATRGGGGKVEILGHQRRRGGVGKVEGGGRRSITSDLHCWNVILEVHRGDVDRSYVLRPQWTGWPEGTKWFTTGLRSPVVPRLQQKSTLKALYFLGNNEEHQQEGGRMHISRPRRCNVYVA